MPKQGKLPPKSNRKKALRAMEAVKPVLVPLCELFSEVDEVFADEGAFDPAHIHKSLGRIYRSWLNTREALDPDFDRERYRNRMKKRPVRTGLSVQPSTGSTTRRTAKSDTSARRAKVRKIDSTSTSQRPSVRRTATAETGSDRSSKKGVGHRSSSSKSVRKKSGKRENG